MQDDDLCRCGHKVCYHVMGGGKCYLCFCKKVQEPPTVALAKKDTYHE